MRFYFKTIKAMAGGEPTKWFQSEIQLVENLRKCLCCRRNWRERKCLSRPSALTPSHLPAVPLPTPTGAVCHRTVQGWLHWPVPACPQPLLCLGPFGAGWSPAVPLLSPCLASLSSANRCGLAVPGTSCRAAFWETLLHGEHTPIYTHP